MEELLEQLLVEFRNPLYPNGGVLTTEAQVRAALIVAWNAGREHGRGDTVQTCTRLSPHVCRVNGPCNGWPKEASDDTDELKSDAWRDAEWHQ